MNEIKLEDLMSLEKYDEVRNTYRAGVIDHKRARQILIGPDIVLFFEDKKTVAYQIQEMLRTEKIFERRGIQDELDAYNSLIPEGNNWKATMMIQIPDVDARRAALARYVGIENSCWVKTGDADPVFALADEDLDRTTSHKTSAVHFLRFQLPESMRAVIKSGEEFSIGFDHVEYEHSVSLVSGALADSLRADLTSD